MKTNSGLRLTALVLLLMLGGCSTVKGWFEQSEESKVAKLTTFKETAKFTVRWRADLGDSGGNMLRPAVSADAVYGVAGNGALTRLDRMSGRQVWRTESAVSVTAGVGHGEGLVLIGSNKGEVLAFSEAGKLGWKAQVSSEVLGTPQAANGVVVVRTGDGSITGLSVADGSRLWVYDRVTPSLVVRSHAGVLIQRDVVFAGLSGGKLIALSLKDGSLLWETSVSQPRGITELERISDITSNPVVDDQQVCAIAFQGRVACYDLAQGNLLWSRDISSDKGLMLLRKYLYLSDDKGMVMALDKTTGNTLWKNEKLFLRDVSAPFSLETGVVAGDFEGYLHGLNRDDGDFVARLKLDDSAVQIAPMALDGGVLVQTKRGGLYSVSLR
ncbi:MAG: outer membrane protein assembly factor BamB [Pseudomonadota bacterium]